MSSIDNSVHFFYREMEVGEARPIRLRISYDDGIRIWHNGEEVYQSSGVSTTNHVSTLQKGRIP